MKKKNAIVPFNPHHLSGIDLAKAEQVINQAFKDYPPVSLYLEPPVFLDTRRMYEGRKVMREKKKVQIEEIGRDL